MDLLTNDLATALYRQHPAESGNRVSGLQILLMIEAYEALQQQLREEMLSSHVTGFSEEHAKTVESTLNHWLQALRSIYEHSLS
jgi:ABC-type thiamine transport system ATPase subunit